MDWWTQALAGQETVPSWNGSENVLRENVHCRDEESWLNTRFKKAREDFQLGSQAGSTLEAEAEGCVWAVLGWSTVGTVQGNNNPCLYLHFLEPVELQPTCHMDCENVLRPRCILSCWMFLGTQGVVRLCFILGIGIFFLSKGQMSSCRLPLDVFMTTILPGPVFPCYS